MMIGVTTGASVPISVISKRLPNLEVNLAAVAEVMQTLGIAEDAIKNTTIYIDSYPHLTIRGSAWPKSLAWLRFPQLAMKGNVIRLSTKMLLSGPTNKTIDHTLVHEIEHIAQIERKDLKILIGNLTELLFLSGGLGLGLSDKSGLLLFRILIITMTSLFGLQLGYMLALHEIQARQTAKSFRLGRKMITNSRNASR